MVKFKDLILNAYFGFDIAKDKEGNPILELVDHEGAYLGGIDSYRFPIDLEHVMEAAISAIDRLDIFWEDTIIESVLESVDEDNREKLEELTLYLPNMLAYIEENKVKVDADDLDMLKAICNPYSVDIEEVHKEILKSFPLSRDEVRNYLLKQGAFISYDENGERYVKEENMDRLFNTERRFQLAYAIRESIALVEYEHWQTLETKLFGEKSEELPYYVSSLINDILWTELKETPIGLVGNKETEEKKNEQHQD